MEKATKQFRGELLPFAFDVDPALGGAEWDVVAEWCAENTHQTDTFIDIGANIGFIAACVGYFSKPKNIIAVEPDRAVLPYLQENLAIYATNYAVLKSLVLDKVGRHEFFYNTDNPAQNSIYEREDLPNKRREVLDCTTVDEIVQIFKIRGPIVLKIDAEFAEPLIWKGIKHCLPQIKAMIMEYNPEYLSRLAGTDANAFGQELMKYFEVRDLNKNNIILLKK